MSYNVYPVTETELFHDGYQIKINGKPVSPDTARVSAFPFNRRWPGHQRTLDQTELVNFLSLETDEELHFELTPKQPFEQVVIRPVTLGIEPEITDDGRILFTLKQPAYFTVEPYGRRNALHIFADPVSRYSVNKDDDNVLYFGKGTHFPGFIQLQSGQTLFLEEGAVVYGCVRAMDAQDITICGRGILDNSQNLETVLYEANEENNEVAVNNVVREHTIQLEYCKNVHIEGITIRDSLVYNIRPIGCEGLCIENVKIIGCWRYNSDGIDMHNCTHVRINNCFIRTFDDSICVKGFDCYYEGDVEKAVHDAMYRNGKSYDIFENVLVTNCVIWNDWGKCLEIGAETRAEEIRDITFQDCHIIHVTGPVLDCMNVDYACVHDVVYRDISIEYDDSLPTPAIQTSDADNVYTNRIPDYAPDMISVLVCFHHEYSAGGGRRGKNHHFLFENIRLYAKQLPNLAFEGYDREHRTSDIRIRGLFLNDRPLSKTELALRQNEFCESITVE